MAMVRTLVVLLRSPRDTVASGQTRRLQHRLAAVFRRFLSGMTALPDHGAAVDDLPPEYFRFPPY
jgi:hypothetical protein